MKLIGDRPQYQLVALEVAKRTDAQTIDALINKFDGIVFRDMKADEKRVLCAKILKECKLYTGHKNTVSDTNHEIDILDRVYEGIMLDYYNLTDKEILHGVKLGLIGSYGTNGGLVMVTPIQIFEWLKSYVNSVKPKMTKILIEAKRSTENVEPQNTDATSAWISILKGWIEQVKKGEKPDYTAGHFVYNFLARKKCPMIVPSDEERESIKKRALQRVLMRKSLNANAKQQKYFRDIMNGVISDQKIDDEKIRESKSMAVERFVDLIVKEGIELNDLIEL